MSVIIKDMGKPEFCFVLIDGKFKYCPFVNTDDDCVLLSKKGIIRDGTWADQYSKCPLIEAPEPCEDAVSRQAAILLLRKDLRNLPSAQPERPKGKWNTYYHSDTEFTYSCNSCGYSAPYQVLGGEVVQKKWDFCPNCGADMRGEQDENR